MKSQSSNRHPDGQLLSEPRQRANRDDGCADSPEECMHLAPESHCRLRKVGAGLAANSTAPNATNARRSDTGMRESNGT